jgi:hypothetical protein
MDFDSATAPSGNVFKYKQELNEGDAVQGVLQAKPEVSPHTDWQTKQQAVTSTGKPKWQLKVILEIDGENKTLYLQDKAYWAAIKAFQDAKGGAADIEYRGGIFGLKRGQDEPSKTAGFAPSKQYVAKFVPPTNE